jgi:hypothetical protein
MKGLETYFEKDKKDKQDQ